MNILKTSLYFIIGGALMFSSCSNEEDGIETTNKLVEKTFHVESSLDAQSRAYIQGLHSTGANVFWNTTDELSAIPVGSHKVKGYVFDFDCYIDNSGNAIQTPSHKADFKGLVLAKDLDSKFCILHPYQDGSYLVSGSEAGVESVHQEDISNKELLYCNIPTIQYAINNQFDPQAYIQVGESTSSGLALKSVCAYLRLTVGAGCKSITLNAPQNNWHLAGDVYVDASSGGGRIEAFGNNVSSEITMKMDKVVTKDADGKDYYPEATYYIAVVPSTSTNSPINITLVFESKKITVSIPKGKPLTAGVFYNVGKFAPQGYTWSTQN